MSVGRPMPPLVLSDDEVQQLQSIANSRSLPHSIVQRAQIVFACGAGETNTAIAKRMGLKGMTVGKWRKRYRDLGLEGLHDELRRSRPRSYEDGKVVEVINQELQSKSPDGAELLTVGPVHPGPAPPSAGGGEDAVAAQQGAHQRGVGVVGLNG